jgi:1-deoxy-D-xylulose-5-phosphate reductoisomerase
MGKTDMALPIQYALTYPDRLETPLAPLDLVSVGALHFAEPNWDAFPGLGLCYEAGRRGGLVPAALNAANEIAVQGFLDGSIGFLDIHEINREVMESFGPDDHGGESASVDSIEEVMRVDALARQSARALVSARLSDSDKD